MTKFYKTNKLLQFGLLMAVGFSLTLFTSCIKNDMTFSTESTLNDILNSLGGVDVIQTLTDMTYTVEGEAFEHEEEEPNVSNPINVKDYTVNVSTKLNARKLNMDFARLDVNYPVAFTSSGAKTIINDKTGTTSGQFSVSSYYFGAVAATPLYASRIEADLKNYMMSNPIELVKSYILDQSDLTSSTINNILKLPTQIAGLDIELHIDRKSNLPSKATITEADFLYGDVVFEVLYGQWKNFGEFKYPTNLEYRYNGEKIKSEIISNVKSNQNLEESIFTPEVTPNEIVYDKEQGKKGIYHSQWYSRLFDIGLPIDMPLQLGFVAGNDWAAFGIPDQTIGTNVKIIGRPDLLYWAIAIKTSEGVIVVDAPLSPEWSRSIINAIKGPDGFPNDNIIAVIPTHDHFDHYSGIREMADEAGKIYVNSEGRSKLESVLNSPHTLVPDALALNNSSTSIEEIDGITKLDAGAVEIHSLDMNQGGDNPHSDNMLMVYIPEYELIIQADLFNAGAMLALFAGQGAFPMNDESKASWNNRAKFLMDYITEKELTVSRIVGMHGGLGSMSQLQFVAN